MHVACARERHRQVRSLVDANTHYLPLLTPTLMLVDERFSVLQRSHALILLNKTVCILRGTTTADDVFSGIIHVDGIEYGMRSDVCFSLHGVLSIGQGENKEERSVLVAINSQTLILYHNE